MCSMEAIRYRQMLDAAEEEVKSARGSAELAVAAAAAAAVIIARKTRLSGCAVDPKEAQLIEKIIHLRAKKANAVRGEGKCWSDALCKASAEGDAQHVQYLLGEIYERGWLYQNMTTAWFTAHLGWAFLQAAASASSSAEVFKLLLNTEVKVDVNQAVEYAGGTLIRPLHAAIKYSKSATVIQAVLNSGADPNLPDQTGFTPLCSAVSLKLLDIVQLLLAHGANPNQQLCSGMLESPLVGAVLSGQTRAVVELLESKADPNFMANFMSPLQTVTTLLGWHTRNGSAHPRQSLDSLTEWGTTLDNPNLLSILEMLLAAGADPNLQPEPNLQREPNLLNDEEEPITMLYVAVGSGNAEAVQMLLAAGADPNQDSSILGMAIQCWNVQARTKIVAALLQHRADPNLGEIIRDPFSQSPNAPDATEARGFSHSRVFSDQMPGFQKIMKFHKIDIENGVEVPPLFVAISTKQLGLVQMLLAYGADPHYTNAIGTTLITAATAGFLPAIELLVDLGVNVNQANKVGATALIMALTFGFLEIANDLILKGAEVAPPAPDESSFSYVSLEHAGKSLPMLVTPGIQTPLNCACELGLVDFAQSLIRRGAVINQRCAHNGGFPLATACQLGHTAVVKMLLDERAEPNRSQSHPSLPGCYAATPLTVASQRGFAPIVELLLQENADPNQLGFSLLALDASALASNECTFALRTAILNEHILVIDLLLAHGADPNLLDHEGWTPLHISIQTGNLEIVKRLVCCYHESQTYNVASNPHLNPAQVIMGHNPDGFAVLQEADRVLGKKHIVTCYIAACQFWTPLMRAVTRRQHETVACLLHAGADPTQECRVGGWRMFTEAGCRCIQPRDRYRCCMSSETALSLAIGTGVVCECGCLRMDVEGAWAEPECPVTTRLIKISLQWSPSSHNLFPPSFRHGIVILLLLQHKLDKLSILPSLPENAWFLIFQSLPREWGYPTRIATLMETQIAVAAGEQARHAQMTLEEDAALPLSGDVEMGVCGATTVDANQQVVDYDNQIRHLEEEMFSSNLNMQEHDSC